MIQAIQFILSLSILIVLHEMGHFFPAKYFKTKVEKFYLFFDPWFSLFKIKRGETEYGIGWLPLGGYVKISGMIDESMDKEQMKLPPQPWEFRAKPAWQRLIIMLGGVTVNVILGILIYAMVLFTWGEEYLPTKNLTYGIACDSVALQMGLKNGDKIISVDNQEVDNFNKIPIKIILNKAQSIQVDRGGQKVDVPIKEGVLSALISKQSFFIEPRVPSNIDSVLVGKPAEKAGLKKGDKIISVNGVPTTYFDEVHNCIKANKNKTIDLVVLRKTDTLKLNSATDSVGAIGIAGPFDLDNYFHYTKTKYSFLGSFPAGLHKAKETIVMQVKQFNVLFTVKDAHKSVGGFISIGKAYSKVWDWQRFWLFTGFLSLVLAFMNLLPIPALDGGHVMFLLYEVVTRRKPNEKAMEYAQYAGMILLLALLLYANGNDVVRLFKK